MQRLIFIHGEAGMCGVVDWFHVLYIYACSINSPTSGPLVDSINDKSLSEVSLHMKGFRYFSFILCTFDLPICFIFRLFNPSSQCSCLLAHCPSLFVSLSSSLTDRSWFSGKNSQGRGAKSGPFWLVAGWLFNLLLSHPLLLHMGGGCGEKVLQTKLGSRWGGRHNWHLLTLNLGTRGESVSFCHSVFFWADFCHNTWGDTSYLRWGEGWVKFSFKGLFGDWLWSPHLGRWGGGG